MLNDVRQDNALVTPRGISKTLLPHGLSFRECKTHVDDRGSVCEMLDPRWGWHPEPMVFSYFYTVRPEKIKGWAVHKKHEDRYFIVSGELLVVLYDTRADSPTEGLISEVYLTEHNRRIMNIPAGIWHAVKNIGSKDALIVNFPTIPYDHNDTDKYRLPLDTDQIPYRFSDEHGL